MLKQEVRVAGAIALAIGTGVLAGSCKHSPAPPELTQIRFLLPTPQPSPGFTQAIASANQALVGARIVVQPHWGSVLVTSAIQEGSGELGLAQADVVYLSYRDNYPASNLRAIAVGALNRLYVFVPRDSSIQSLYDLRGRRVAVAPEGTAGALLTQMVLSAHGLNSEDVQLRVHQIADMGRFLHSEKLEAMIMVGSIDPNTITAPALVQDLRLVPLDREIINQLRADYPFIKPTATSPLHGAAQSSVPTVGADSLIICRRDLGETLVYELTKALLSNAVTADALSLDSDTAAATPIPLHPGAARFYRELQVQ